MNYLPLILLAIVAFAISMVVSSYQSKKKFLTSVRDSFGKTPTKLDYSLNTIPTYYDTKQEYADIPPFIDETTWFDLDMNSVYKQLNHCLSSVGEEYLFDTLHYPEFNEDKLLQRERLVDYLDSNEEQRCKLRVFLATMGKRKYSNTASLIFNAKEKILLHAWVYPIFAVLPLLFAVVAFFSLEIGFIGLVLSVILNGVTYYRIKGRIETQLETLHYFSAMMWCSKKILALKDKTLLSYLPNLQQNYDCFKSAFSKSAGLMQKSFSDFEFLAEYIKIIFLMDIIGYNKVMKQIVSHSKELHDLYRTIGELDMAIGILSYRKSVEVYCLPTFHEEKQIIFEELVHPLLNHPIANSGEINKNSIITGSNASGKSTFIKALAINGILAQTIHTCLAKTFATRFQLIVSSMAMNDSILEGESYFVTEIKSLKRILNMVELLPCACFIDEILRGTNTVERIAASTAVLHYLDKTNALCLVASHDRELTELLENSFDNYHFSDTITDEGIAFDYKLKNGVSTTTNAIKLIDHMGFDAAIVQEAETLSNQFSETGLWESHI